MSVVKPTTCIRLTETARSMRAIGNTSSKNKLGTEVWDLLHAGANTVSNLIVTRMVTKESKK